MASETMAPSRKRIFRCCLRLTSVAYSIRSWRALNDGCLWGCMAIDLCKKRSTHRLAGRTEAGAGSSFPERTVCTARTTPTATGPAKTGSLLRQTVHLGRHRPAHERPVPAHEPCNRRRDPLHATTKCHLRSSHGRPGGGQNQGGPTRTPPDRVGLGGCQVLERMTGRLFNLAQRFNDTPWADVESLIAQEVFSYRASSGGASPDCSPTSICPSGPRAVSLISWIVTAPTTF